VAGAAPWAWSLDSVPFARVYVDGRFRGITPLQQLALPAGKHRLRLVDPERGISATQRIVIRTGRTLRKVLTLR